MHKTDVELFGEASWLQVMIGQGLMPQSYHPIVDNMSDNELQQFLDGIKHTIKRRVDSLPDHRLFMGRYCQSVVNH